MMMIMMNLDTQVKTRKSGRFEYITWCMQFVILKIIEKNIFSFSLPLHWCQRLYSRDAAEFQCCFVEPQYERSNHLSNYK